eukprot:CAMPEP_0201506664 /NCGR_PEP_ID=MMETSP0161_2-20130828/550_1 /ASSEMBLY_ACC=CAM_ASM_000251 /TAXON_ID=180227 /ORGANISM="Neoparamoeba aestuarina, Strain SoJaBio B1-5/56/2" /LENGTH=367 /DNA_ID=CAMNT_0047900827 /DNA_START=139 /DNA_END=1242 /DNA_ORIENTATION=+
MEYPSSNAEYQPLREPGSNKEPFLDQFFSTPTRRITLLILSSLLLVGMLTVSVIVVVNVSYGNNEPNTVQSSDYPPCGAELHMGDLCWYPILGLHPTQYSVGFEEIRCKDEELYAFTEDELDHYLAKKIVPVVLGPDNVPYMLDRHHTSSVVLFTERSTVMLVQVKEDWSQYSSSVFWQKMIENKWVYLFNPQQTFEQPPQYIPPHVSGLLDDPYRSLAYFARKCGAFGDTGIPYLEYAWAAYYRTKIEPNVEIPDNDYCNVYEYDTELCWPERDQNEWVIASLPLAVNLSFSEEAMNIPGYGLGVIEGIPCQETVFAGWECPPLPPQAPPIPTKAKKEKKEKKEKKDKKDKKDKKEKKERETPSTF